MRSGALKKSGQKILGVGVWVLTSAAHMLTLKKLTKPSFGDTEKEMEELEFSYTSSGNVKQNNYFKNHSKCAPKSLQMVTVAMKLKDTCSLEGKQ